jgi:hypothetical protein
VINALASETSTIASLTVASAPPGDDDADPRSLHERSAAKHTTTAPLPRIAFTLAPPDADALTGSSPSTPPSAPATR